MSPAALRLLTVRATTIRGTSRDDAPSWPVSVWSTRVGASRIPRPVAPWPRLLAPEVIVDVDVLRAPRRRRPAAARWLHCRQGLAVGPGHGRSRRPAARSRSRGSTSTTGRPSWPAPRPCPRPPARPSRRCRRFDVPLDAVLAGGEALRTGRDDVLDELVDRRWAPPRRPTECRRGPTCAPSWSGSHRGTVGRLRASVAAARRRHRPRVGWVSWVLFADGWRSLTPVVA